jgi:hypothetical protein
LYNKRNLKGFLQISAAKVTPTDINFLIRLTTKIF